MLAHTTECMGQRTCPWRGLWCRYGVDTWARRARFIAFGVRSTGSYFFQKEAYCPSHDRHNTVCLWWCEPPRIGFGYDLACFYILQVQFIVSKYHNSPKIIPGNINLDAYLDKWFGTHSTEINLELGYGVVPGIRFKIFYSRRSLSKSQLAEMPAH